MHDIYYHLFIFTIFALLFVLSMLLCNNFPYASHRFNEIDELLFSKVL